MRINAFKSESVPEESWYKGPTLKQKYLFTKTSLTQRIFLYSVSLVHFIYYPSGYWFPEGIQKQAAVADECQLSLISFMYSPLSLNFLMNSLICRETEEIMEMF